MPGTFVRSASRRRWTNPTTSRARRSGASGTRARTISYSFWARRVVDPVVEAAALERVVDLAGPVRGEDDARRRLGLDRADLGDGDLEVGQDLEEVGLELLVGPVDLVDQEDRRRRRRVASSAWRSGRRIRKSGAEDVVGGRAGRPRRGPRAAGSRASGAGSSTRRPRC